MYSPVQRGVTCVYWLDTALSDLSYNFCADENFLRNQNHNLAAGTVFVCTESNSVCGTGCIGFADDCSRFFRDVLPWVGTPDGSPGGAVRCGGLLDQQ